MDRRQFLSFIAGTVALPSVAYAFPSAPPQPHRLNLLNANTKETFSGIYRDDNGPIPRVMDELSIFLRDFHFGDKLGDAMKAARAMQRGGVGWYPDSSFMHIDTGPVRNWEIDKKDRATLLVGNNKIQFDKHGKMLITKAN